MDFLQSFLYGLLSGLTEILPISSSGHQILFKEVMGVRTPTPVADIFIHIGVIFAIVVSSFSYIRKVIRVSESSGNRKSRSHLAEKSIFYDLRLIRGAVLPLIIVMLLNLITQKFFSRLWLTALLFAVNGLIIYVPEHLAHGNKDAGKLTTLDGVVLGTARGLSVFPGLSGIGIALTCGVARGADVKKVFHWLLMISIPASVCMIILQLIGIFVSGVGVISFAILLGYFVAGIAAFFAALGGIYLMRFMVEHSGYSALGFYCWGAAILTFIIYLTA